MISVQIIKSLPKPSKNSNNVPDKHYILTEKFVLTHNRKNLYWFLTETYLTRTNITILKNPNEKKNLFIVIFTWTSNHISLDGWFNFPNFYSFIFWLHNFFCVTLILPFWFSSLLHLKETIKIIQKKPFSIYIHELSFVLNKQISSSSQKASSIKVISVLLV